MVLRDFAERTQETYLACVSHLAKHTGRSPDTLDTAAIQAYLLHLITERKLAYASVNQAACAIRFLFAVARTALAVPPPEPAIIESVAAFLCRVNRLESM